MSNKGMQDSGFTWHAGDEWIWWNTGREPNHVSAIRTGGEVKQFHAKSQYKGGKVNRVDWNEKADAVGEFEGPTTTKNEATDKWDSWLPAAEAAGEDDDQRAEEEYEEVVGIRLSPPYGRSVIARWRDSKPGSGSELGSCRRAESRSTSRV